MYTHQGSLQQRFQNFLDKADNPSHSELLYGRAAAALASQLMSPAAIEQVFAFLAGADQVPMSISLLGNTVLHTLVIEITSARVAQRVQTKRGLDGRAWRSIDLEPRA
jgi:hypothetical protein